MITALTIAGAPVDLGLVLAANVTVLHGRAAFDDGPTPSAADLTLLIPETAGMPAWSAGDPLTLATGHGPLFTGTITDRRLPGHVDTTELGRCAQLELMCAGPLAGAGYRIVGDQPWPQEIGTARATRILNLAALPALVEPPIPTRPEVQVLARDVDAQPALGLLEDLATDTGAAVVDLPDGRVLYQPLEARARPAFPVRWQDYDPALTWSAVGPAVKWSDLTQRSPGSSVPVPLPPGAVLAEPEWVSGAGAMINHARIGYGPIPEGGQQATEEASDAASSARYGRRYAYLGTQIATSADAAKRASRIVTTQARERWALGSITVWADQLDPATQAAIAGLVCGDWVQVDALPQPAPARSWAGIVEGWTYTETKSAARHDTWWTLALSDPQHSLAVMTWADHPAAYRWADYPAALIWADLTDTTQLEAA